MDGQDWGYTVENGEFTVYLITKNILSSTEASVWNRFVYIAARDETYFTFVKKNNHHPQSFATIVSSVVVKVYSLLLMMELMNCNNYDSETMKTRSMT